MNALRQMQFVSIPDYLAGEEASDVKHEYIGGTVHAMAGATNRHNMIATSALLSLGAQLRGKSCQPFNSGTKVRLEVPDHTRFYYPDAMVVCDSNSGTDHFQDRPVAIIEVLSDSTRRHDLLEKCPAYRSIPTLKVLIFVELDFPAVIVHRRKPEGGFAVENHAGLDGIVLLPEIDATLPLADLYERVELPA